MDGGRMSKSSHSIFELGRHYKYDFGFSLAAHCGGGALQYLSGMTRPVLLQLMVRAVDQVSPNRIYRFDQTPSARIARLRKEAGGTPPGVRRDELLRRAQQIDDDTSKGSLIT
jgi:hypothetical protein